MQVSYNDIASSKFRVTYHVKVKNKGHSQHKAEPEWGFFFFWKDADKYHTRSPGRIKERCVQSKKPPTNTCVQ